MRVSLRLCAILSKVIRDDVYLLHTSTWAILSCADLAALDGRVMLLVPSCLGSIDMLFMHKPHDAETFFQLHPTQP